MQVAEAFEHPRLATTIVDVAEREKPLLALGRWLRRHAFPVDGLEVRALVPVSVRADVERGALGNRVSAMYAPLPVGLSDPELAYRRVHEAMAGLKESGQAVGAQVITQLGDFAPPTILSQAARLQMRQRWFNVVVTNVPGPQFPLYVLGRQMEAIFPMVPLARRQALCVGIMSYNGQVNFGLIGDYDAMAGLDSFALDLEAATKEIVDKAPKAKQKAQRTTSARTRNGAMSVK